MFPTFERYRPGSETGTNERFFINHVSALQKQFSFYFKDVDVRKPFAANNVSGLKTCEQEQLRGSSERHG
jgi:hypothetical protein